MHINVDLIDSHEITQEEIKQVAEQALVKITWTLIKNSGKKSQNCGKKLLRKIFDKVLVS